MNTHSHKCFKKKKKNPSPVPSVKKAGINLIMNGYKKWKEESVL